MKKIILILIFSIFFGCGQKYAWKKTDKKRKLELVNSFEFIKFNNLFFREKVTLKEFDKELGINNIIKDSSYSDMPTREILKDSIRWHFHYQECRNLDFNVSQVIRAFFKGNYWYHFNFSIRNDTIIGVKISESNFVLFEKYDDKKFNKYFQEHKSFYNSKTKDFGGKLGPLNLDNFGTLYNGTGLVMIPDCKIMINQVKKGNKRLLKKWLTSMNPEKQAYAVQGFYYLQKYKGLEITNEELKFINHIKNLDRTIRCNGNVIVKTKEILNADYFDKQYLYLKERGLIK